MSGLFNVYERLRKHMRWRVDGIRGSTPRARKGQVINHCKVKQENEMIEVLKLLRHNPQR